MEALKPRKVEQLQAENLAILEPGHGGEALVPIRTGGDTGSVTYPVRDVSSWELASHEVVGLTEHPWLRDGSGQQLHL